MEEVPRLRDMSEFAFGVSTCQVEGEIVPVADLNLRRGDQVYFQHHVMLRKDPAVAMSVLPIRDGCWGGWPTIAVGH